MITVLQSDKLCTPTAATIGMFDGVHSGHRFVLDFLKREAAKRGLEATVITFNEHPQTVLHPHSDLKMITPPAEKLAELSKTGIYGTVLLDFTEELSRLSAKEFIEFINRQYNVNLLVIGYDHRFGHSSDDTFNDYVRYGKEAGVEIIQAPEYEPDVQHISSSAIRKALAAGEVTEAAAMLGRPFSLTGAVVKGFQNGRKIGFPTANIDVNKSVIIPKTGVYAASATLPDGVTKGGMLNIGYRPTFRNSNDLSVEINIFDFDNDIYGQTLTFTIYERLRDEKKMNGIDALIAQLIEDKENTREILKKYKL